jgi:hypothetical protein
MNFVAQMTKPGLEVTTESTLLLDGLPQFDAKTLVSHLEPLLNGDPVQILKEDVTEHNRYITLQASGCIITIEAGNDIRQAAAYFEALDWPMLHRMFPDAEAAVRTHLAHVHISVEIEYDAMATALGIRAMNASFTRSMLAARVTVAACRCAMPMAIHWKSCEMLYKPGPFIRELETDPVSLFVRVTPFSSNRQIGGMRVIGGSTRGAAALLGAEAVLEEAPVSVDWAMATLHMFVSRCHAKGAYLPHLTTFAPSKGDVIVVRHLDSSPEIDQPHVSLEVRLAAEFGYDAAMDAPVAIQPASMAAQKWSGTDRRVRPRSAKPFGRRSLT